MFTLNHAAYPTDNCVNGSVRLIDRRHTSEGMLELCLDGQWGTLCDPFEFSDNEASVVCRQLGFSPEGSPPLPLSSQSSFFLACESTGCLVYMCAGWHPHQGVSAMEREEETEQSYTVFILLAMALKSPFSTVIPFKLMTNVPYLYTWFV